MNYEHLKPMNARALGVMEKYAAAAICVPSGRRNAEALNSAQF
ncbi:MAG TPA: hypothetical protein VIJ65_00230 [Acidobacteriaceae bacterium]